MGGHYVHRLNYLCKTVTLNCVFTGLNTALCTLYSVNLRQHYNLPSNQSLNNYSQKGGVVSGVGQW